MKILLFGGSGQLGYEIKTRAYDLNFEIIAPVSSEVDVSNYAQVSFLTTQSRPDLVVNCAAYTAIDRAENDREACFRINRDGAANVAKAVAAQGGRLIHLSTDQVFPGNGNVLLREDDTVAPVNVYGESKLAGEEEVLRCLGGKALVLRTSALHGQRGVNFVNTMLRLFSERHELRVVNDQCLSPTWAGWLAEVILDLGRSGEAGIVHACSEGVLSWYDFACAIHEYARPVASLKIVPVTSEEFGRPARRPHFSGLDCTRLTRILGRRPLSWQEGLRRHIQEVRAMQKQK